MKRQLDSIEIGAKNRLGMIAPSRYPLLPSSNTTQPDQSFTVSELMQGFVVGRVPAMATHLDYDLDPQSVNGTQIPMLSLSQAELYAKQVKERLEAAKSRYAHLQDHIKSQQKKAAADSAALAERVSALESKDTK